MGSWAVRILTWASVLICAISNVANLHVGMKHINSASFILTNLGCICASKEDLFGLIKNLCAAHPEIRNDVRMFAPDMNIDKMAHEIEAAARKIHTKLPYDRYHLSSQSLF